MKLYKTTIATLLALTASTALAVAPGSGPKREELSKADARVGQLAGQTKGAPQHLLLQQRQRIRQLIQDIDAGRRVDPADIDRALQDAERGF